MRTGSWYSKDTRIGVMRMKKMLHTERKYFLERDEVYLRIIKVGLDDQRSSGIQAQENREGSNHSRPNVMQQVSFVFEHI
jgi:hypothetical protein